MPPDPVTQPGLWIGSSGSRSSPARVSCGGPEYRFRLLTVSWRICNGTASWNIFRRRVVADRQFSRFQNSWKSSKRNCVLSLTEVQSRIGPTSVTQCKKTILGTVAEDGPIPRASVTGPLLNRGSSQQRDGCCEDDQPQLIQPPSCRRWPYSGCAARASVTGRGSMTCRWPQS